MVKKEKESKKGSNLVKIKQILKKQDSKVTIKDFKAPSVLGDPNRFFKDEMEETRKSLLFQ